MANGPNNGDNGPAAGVALPWIASTIWRRGGESGHWWGD
jgi:hypothetical protein